MRCRAMPHAVVLQHVPHEGPGRLGGLLRAAGWTIEERRLDQGAAVPVAERAGDLLVVMGGPMGVGDLGDPRWPFLSAEVALLRARLAERRPVLGICLGAQLLAHAAGARVTPNRVREVGWGPLRWLVDDPLLDGVERDAPMLHWHGDAFAIPAGAVHLAATDACATQAFRRGRAVGLQFHPEVDADQLDTWIAEDHAYACGALGPDAATLLRDGWRAHHARYIAAGDRLLRNVIALATTPEPPWTA